MEYRIKYTDKCLEDIDSIYEYILKEFKSEITLKKLGTKINTTIKVLANSPKAYASIQKVDKLKRQYRRIPINNFVLLYTIDEEKKIVYIAHMFYG